MNKKWHKCSKNQNKCSKNLHNCSENWHKCSKNQINFSNVSFSDYLFFIVTFTSSHGKKGLRRVLKIMDSTTQVTPKQKKIRNKLFCPLNLKEFLFSFLPLYWLRRGGRRVRGQGTYLLKSRVIFLTPSLTCSCISLLKV